MNSALDLPDEKLNEYERRMIAAIRKHGWWSTTVNSEDENTPSYTYTTGMWLTAGQPELVVFSIDGSSAHDVFADVYDQARSGRRLPLVAPIDGLFGEGFHAVLLPTHPPRHRDYLLSSRWFYGRDDFGSVQLIWPDETGFFPWQPGVDKQFAGSQPDLTIGAWGGLATVTI